MGLGWEETERGARGELAMRKDLDDIIQAWPYDPEPGEVLAREVRARDGRVVLQIRIELGILQMEAVDRPDGLRPHGVATYLEHLREHVTNHEDEGDDEGWTMSRSQQIEADREFVQFYHRRMAWLALRRYDKAVRDADHTLAMMDLVRRRGGDIGYIASHEQFRGLVLFHRAQALAASALERRRPEEAIDALRDGAEKIARHQRIWWEERDPTESPNPSLIEQLRLGEQEIRKNFAVEKTLREQLDDAVAREDYERAALIRDQIVAQDRTRT